MEVKMITPEILEQVQELIDELRGYAAEGTPILVEGSRDRKALRELGVRGQIFQISGKKTALNFLDGLVGYKQVVIMTDFDRTGDEMAKFCAKHLKGLGPKPIIDLREKLRALLRKDIKDIQGLAKFLRTQQDVLHMTRPI
jgi:5S rRNA maturation endonuclease (ribonuclease M5)